MKELRGHWVASLAVLVAALAACKPEVLPLGDDPGEAGSDGGGTGSVGQGGGGAVPSTHPGGGTAGTATAGGGYGNTAGTAGSSPGAGGDGSTCYSPGSADLAFDDAAEGCPCGEDGVGECVRTTHEGRPWDVALVCQDGKWQSVEDGPCDGGAVCRVNDVDYPSGAANVPSPYSCNTCSCNNGKLENCTRADCGVGCPEGSFAAVRCAKCGPVDECEIVETGCFTDPSCETGVCITGICG